MVSFSTMTLVDTLFVSRLGAAALAGVGLGGTTAFALVCFGMGLLKSERIVVSQALGGGKRQELPGFLGAGILLGLALGALFGLLGQPLSWLLEVLSASEESGRHARTYLSIRSAGSSIVLAYMAFRVFRYGLGDSRTPMVATLLGNGANIVLDYVLIFVLGWGVAGAAWATLLGQLVELAVLVSAQYASEIRPARPRRRHFAEIWRLGHVTGLQFLLEVGSFFLLAVLLAALDEVEMAAHQIAIQVIHFTFLPIVAVGEAAAVLAGQAVGAARDDLVRPIARRALGLGALYAGAWTVILGTLAWPLSGFFTDDAALAAAVVGLLHIAAVFQLFDAANIVARLVLQGTGDVRFPAVAGITLAWLMTPPATWLLGYKAGLGAFGGWLGLCGEIVLISAVLWWRLERGAWQQSAEKSRIRLALDLSPAE